MNSERLEFIKNKINVDCIHLNWDELYEIFILYRNQGHYLSDELVIFILAIENYLNGDLSTIYDDECIEIDSFTQIGYISSWFLYEWDHNEFAENLGYDEDEYDEVEGWSQSFGSIINAIKLLKTIYPDE